MELIFFSFLFALISIIHRYKSATGREKLVWETGRVENNKEENE